MEEILRLLLQADAQATTDERIKALSQAIDKLATHVERLALMYGALSLIQMLLLVCGIVGVVLYYELRIRKIEKRVRLLESKAT